MIKRHLGLGALAVVLGFSGLALADEKVALDVRAVAVDTDYSSGMPALRIEFTRDGTKTWSEFTARHVGKVVQMSIDGTVVTSPMIQSRITTPQVILSGPFTRYDLEQMAQKIEAGAAVEVTADE